MSKYERRSFIQNCLTVPLVGNLFGWHEFLSKEAPDFGAVDFVRLVNSLQVTHKCKAAGFKPLGMLLADPLSKRFIACKNSERFGIGASFASHLDPKCEDEMLPGWRSRAYCSADGSDYVVALVRAPKDAFIRSLYASDSSGVIFRARVTSEYSLPAELRSRSDLNVRLSPVRIFEANDGLRIVRGLSERIGLSYMAPQDNHPCISPAPTCGGHCLGSQCFCYNCGADGCGWCCFPDCESCFLAGHGQSCTCCN